MSCPPETGSPPDFPWDGSGFQGGTFTLKSGNTMGAGNSGGITLTGGSGGMANVQGGSITITGGTAQTQFMPIQHATQAQVDQMQREIDDLKKLVSDLVDRNTRLEDEIEAIKDGALLE